MEGVLVGLDVHKKSITASAVDKQGNVVAENKFPASESVLLKAMERFDKPTLVMETGRGYHVWYDLFTEHGYFHVHAVKIHHRDECNECEKDTAPFMMRLFM